MRRQKIYYLYINLMLCPYLADLVTPLKKYLGIGKCSEKGDKNNKGYGTASVWGQINKTGDFHRGKETTKEGYDWGLQNHDWSVEKVNTEVSFTSFHNTKSRRSPNETSSTFKTNKRKYFFTQRTVNLWNSLLEDVVKGKTMSGLKTRTGR